MGEFLINFISKYLESVKYTQCKNFYKNFLRCTIYKNKTKTLQWPSTDKYMSYFYAFICMCACVFVCVCAHVVCVLDTSWTCVRRGNYIWENFSIDWPIGKPKAHYLYPN